MELEDLLLTPEEIRQAIAQDASMIVSNSSEPLSTEPDIFDELETWEGRYSSMLAAASRIAINCKTLMTIYAGDKK